MSQKKLLKILQRKHMKIRNFGKRNGKETNPPFLDRLWAVRYQETASCQETNMLHLKNQPFLNSEKSSVHHPPRMTLGPFLRDFRKFFGFSSSFPPFLELPELPPPPSPTSRKRSQLSGTKEVFNA